ncbi:MAG: HAD-IIA family hydrolase [Armatimonadota bacterium]
MTVDLARIRHVVLDMDGTIYCGEQLFDCTLPFLDLLKRLDINHTFLTNNTSRSKTDYIAKLEKRGISATVEQMYTAADSTLSYLHDQLPDVKRVAILGTPSLAAQFAEAGLTDDWESPEAVVVGFDTGLEYHRLCKTAYFIQQGLPFIATHPDLICPTEEPTVLVDCGAICTCLTAVTGRTPIVLGKPEPSLLLDICRKANVQPEETLMVGDRIYTDVAMGRRAGVPAVLVLSGEGTREEAAASPLPPDLIVTDVGELGTLLQQARE